MDGVRHHLVRLIRIVLLAAVCIGPHPLVASDPVPTLPSSRIAVVGDMQRTGAIEFWREKNHGASARIMRRVAAEQPTALILLGDMVWWGSSQDEWLRFDSIMLPIDRTRIPTYPILGNHEYLGDTAIGLQHVRDRFPSVQLDHDVRVIDSVAVVLLNTNVGSMTDSAALRQEQWLAYMLRRLDADAAIMHVVVCGHHPPFTNSRITRPSTQMQHRFLPHIQRAHKTSYWFAGHAHSYERFQIEGKQYIVAGGGGAPRQRVRLATEGARFADMYDGPALRPLHYLMLERRGRALTCTMYPLGAAPSVVPRDIATVTIGPQSTDAAATSLASMRATIFPLLITPGRPAPGCVPAPVK